MANHGQQPKGSTMSYTDDIPLDLATRAHGGTSMVPERRGAQERESYAATLAGDLEMLGKYATTDAKREILAVEFERYRDGYRRRYLDRLSALSRCLSSMITGPSNFPTRRNAKRNASADKRTDDLIGYREHALAAIKRKLRPELAPVMAGDADAVPRLDSKVEKAESQLALMKAINAAIRKHRKAGPEAQVAAIIALGLSDATARKLLVPDFANRIGIPSYEITNLGANIRRMRGRSEVIAEAQATEATEIAGENARYEDCPADNRVRLFYPGKPAAEIRARLKSAGFRWAPSIGCWQAYRNHRTITTAQREAGAPVAAAPEESATI